MLPRAICWAPERASYAKAVARFDAAGQPVIENFRGTLPVEAEETSRRYREAIDSLPPGVAHFALHATMPGEIEAITADHAGWRTREFALLRSGAIAEWCTEAGIVTIGYREIQRLWRDSVAQGGGVSC